MTKITLRRSQDVAWKSVFFT